MATIIVAVGAIAAGCSAGTNGASSTTTSTVIKPGPYASQAEQVISDLAAGDYQAVVAAEDPATQLRLSAPVLHSGWQDFQEEAGSYEGHGTPEFFPIHAITLEQVPLTMKYGHEVARITFNTSGQIVGLLLTRPSTPIPSGL